MRGGYKAILTLYAALTAVFCLPAATPCRAEAMMALDAQGKPWTGDLDGMVERRTIRVLVPYSKTFYFVDLKGNQRGISFDLMREFDNTLNSKLKTGNLRINVVFVPVSRDQLIPALIDGRGVRNIYKYYVAYKLLLDQQHLRKEEEAKS